VGALLSLFPDPHYGVAENRAGVIFGRIANTLRCDVSIQEFLVGNTGGLCAELFRLWSNGTRSGKKWAAWSCRFGHFFALRKKHRDLRRFGQEIRNPPGLNQPCRQDCYLLQTKIDVSAENSNRLGHAYCRPAGSSGRFGAVRHRLGAPYSGPHPMDRRQSLPQHRAVHVDAKLPGVCAFVFPRVERGLQSEIHHDQLCRCRSKPVHPLIRPTARLI